MENIMSPETWLLITHTASLFPIGVFLWSWKQRKDPCSIFLLIKFVYCVSFSLFYHTYHVPSIPTVEDDQGVWTLLDGYASTALIFTTCLYGLRVRPPQFYITSYAVETAVLVLYLFDHTWHVMLYGLVLACTTVAVFKWRTVYRYLIKFYVWSFLTVLFGVMATVYFILAPRRGHGSVHVLPLPVALHHFPHRRLLLCPSVQVRRGIVHAGGTPWTPYNVGSK